jgi:phosphatidylglycerol:prolipoprotein diacylglycerol transferase
MAPQFLGRRRPVFPEPLRLGPLAFSFYGLMAALGVLAALALFRFTAPRRDLTPASARDFCFWMVVFGFLGARIFYVVFHWPEFAGQPGQVFAYWRGGLMFQGGFLTALAVSPWLLRRYGLGFWPTMDVMAPSLALGQAFGRVGCFGAGCCYGRLTEPGRILAVVFPEHS